MCSKVTRYFGQKKKKILAVLTTYLVDCIIVVSIYIMQKTKDNHLMQVFIQHILLSNYITT